MYKKKSLILTVLLVVVSMFALTACGSNKEEPTAKDDSNKETVTDTIKVTHELGEATVNKNPKKVVVFDYGVIDSLDKMGIEVNGLPKSNLPAFLKKYENDKYEDIGTLFEPNFEKIHEMKPDLIIISGRQAKQYDELNKIAPTVYFNLDGANYMDSFKENMKTLGKIFDKESVISDELKNIDDSVKKLSDKAKSNGKNGLVILANDGTLSAYGEGSRFGIIHKEFGVTPVDKNIEVSNHGQNISFEYIVEKDPDHIFVIDRTAVVGGNTSAKQVLENDLIKNTKAYKNKQIVYLNPEIWYISTGGLNSTMEMIKEVEEGIK